MTEPCLFVFFGLRFMSLGKKNLVCNFNSALRGLGCIKCFVFNFKYQVIETLIIILLTGLLAFAMESQDIAAVFREENSTLVSQYSNFKE